MTKVFINPGHAPNGNPDPGAVGATGLRESDVAADVGRRVSEFLANVGYDTEILQSDSLEEICEASNSWGANIFVSIHCNSFGKPEATGTEVWTSPGQTYGDKLATCIMEQMAGAFPELPIRSDYADGDVDKEGRLYVVLYTDAPAVLVELAFISNPKEEKLLSQANCRSQWAAAIARGITDYCRDINL